MSYLAKLFVPLFVLTMLLFIVFLLTKIADQQKKIHRMEIETGCVFLGSPKNIPSVGTFDCNGVIENKRMKW